MYPRRPSTLPRTPKGASGGSGASTLPTLPSASHERIGDVSGGRLVAGTLRTPPNRGGAIGGGRVQRKFLNLGRVRSQALDLCLVRDFAEGVEFFGGT